MEASLAAEADISPEGIDIGARLIACLGDLSTAVRKLQARPRPLPWDVCHPVPLEPLASAAAGSLIDERWQPRQYYTWQIMLISIFFGAGATSALAYTTADASGILPNNARKSFVPDAAGMAVWEPKGLLLNPGDQLSFTSAGGGITVTGQAIEVRTDWLTDYLM